MNQHFINIKVDREERPDLDDIYQKSAQVFSGRSGGWPLTMFLTPDQEPFYGGTYFPPVPRHSLPAFPDVLRGVIEAYRNHPDEVQKNIERVKNGLLRISTPKSSATPLTERLLDQAGSELGGWFDPVHGGFGDGPKFPTVPPLNLMLRQAAKKTDPSLQEKVLRQLRTMAAGGIYDHVGGGFHRYAVDAQWRVPHFEKMLYDQAQLVMAYLDACQISGDAFYASIAEDTLEYVARDLTAPDGAFFSAEDADSVVPAPAGASNSGNSERSSQPPHAGAVEKREGAFYVWTAGELAALLGDDAPIATRRFGVEAHGNALADPQGEFE